MIETNAENLKDRKEQSFETWNLLPVYKKSNKACRGRELNPRTSARLDPESTVRLDLRSSLARWRFLIDRPQIELGCGKMLPYEVIKMSRQRIKTTWKIPSEDGLLRKYARYLRDKGIRSSTLDSYVFRVGRYLNYCDQKQPSQETPQNFRDQIMDDGLSRSSVNNYCFAIRKFHQMLGLDFEFAFLKPHSTPHQLWFKMDATYWPSNKWCGITIYKPSCAICILQINTNARAMIGSWSYRRPKYD